ncbi:MAG: sulfite exporter TauE/SafE family protein [Bacteroidota bacterium]|nr:sulfite exporter TauE/SafE family protein [Bacteroidota bacterium]
MNQQSVLFMIAAGITTGIIHVFSGPDHLAAIAPFAMKRERGAWRTGLRWGLGHASGVAVVGILSLILRDILPVHLISHWSDRLVGAMLVGIGLWTLHKALHIHTHIHFHNGEAHEHVHMHGYTDLKTHPAKHHIHTHAAFGIGTLHGLAGSSHFLAIIPTLAMPSNVLAVAYLGSFGVGTVAAMIIFACTINSLSLHFAGTAKIYRGVMFACSGIAFGVGSVWLLGFSF